MPSNYSTSTSNSDYTPPSNYYTATRNSRTSTTSKIITKSRSKTTTKRTRKYTSCENCIEKKIKCDKSLFCSPCIMRNYTCVWKRGTPNKPISEKDELAKAKLEIKELKLKIESLELILFESSLSPSSRSNVIGKPKNNNEMDEENEEEIEDFEEEEEEDIKPTPLNLNLFEENFLTNSPSPLSLSPQLQLQPQPRHHIQHHIQHQILNPTPIRPQPYPIQLPLSPLTSSSSSSMEENFSSFSNSSFTNNNNINLEQFYPPSYFELNPSSTSNPYSQPLVSFPISTIRTINSQLNSNNNLTSTTSIDNNIIPYPTPPTNNSFPSNSNSNSNPYKFQSNQSQIQLKYATPATTTTNELEEEINSQSKPYQIHPPQFIPFASTSNSFNFPSTNIINSNELLFKPLFPNQTYQNNEIKEGEKKKSRGRGRGWKSF